MRSKTTVIALLHLASSFVAFAADSASDAGNNGFSISYFGCNNTWNPTFPSNSKVPIGSVCNLKLKLTSLRSSNVSSNTKDTLAGQLSLLVTAGMETIRNKFLLGVDYFLVAGKEITIQTIGVTEIDLSGLTMTLPNMCGQTYMAVRVSVNGTGFEQSKPIQMECQEKSVDVAVIGETTEDVVPVIHTTGQPLSYYISGLKLWVQNSGKETISARTGFSALCALVYIKPQRWYMHDWKVKKLSNQTVAHVDEKLLKYELGDILLNKDDCLLPTQGGRGTPPLTPGYQFELNTQELTLNSKEVCSNAMMIVYVDSLFKPTDSNRLNNYFILPLFIDCWGHSPVQNVESCQVIPNYYDGGQTAWITYSVSGQVTVYEYKTNDRSVRQLKSVEDEVTIQEIAKMKVQTEIQSYRLSEFGQCVDTLWGSSDSFVTWLDVLLSSICKHFDEIVTENKIQESDFRKIKTICNAASELLQLMLQPSHPLHKLLHVPFQALINPIYPDRTSPASDYYDNRVKRDTLQGTNETSRPSLTVPTTASPPMTAEQTYFNTNSSTETTANLPGTGGGGTTSTTPLTYSTSTSTKEATVKKSIGESSTTVRLTTQFTTVTSSPAPAAQGSPTTPSSFTTNQSTTLASNNSEISESDERRAFGPKNPWHRIIADTFFDLIQNGGTNYYIFTKERWQTLCNMLKTFTYGRQADLDRYPYIPALTRQRIMDIIQMIIRQDLPHLFDNMPRPLYDTVSNWISEKMRTTSKFGHAACDYQEGLTLALNKTLELLKSNDTTLYKDSLKLISYVLQVALKDDHVEYFARLYSQIASDETIAKAWMIHDGAPMHEPSTEDVCKRSTAVKMWQLMDYPVFPFAAKTMSPDNYKAVFWEQDNGAIFRGDRSDLTGQVIWTKVATCSCPGGSSCNQSTATNSATPSNMVLGSVVKNDATVNIEHRDKPPVEHEIHHSDTEDDLIFSN